MTVLRYTDFVLTLETYETGPVDVDGTTYKLEVDEKKEGETHVRATRDGNPYQDLSVRVAGEELERGEFFLSPDADPRIVTRLEEEGFVSRTGRSTNLAGEEVEGYIVNFV